MNTPRIAQSTTTIAQLNEWSNRSNSANLTITVRLADDEIVSQHENMPAAVRYLEKFADRRGWFYSRHRVDARNWAGAFNLRNSADHLATYTITKTQ
jgi:hypothetical protein